LESCAAKLAATNGKSNHPTTNGRISFMGHSTNKKVTVARRPQRGLRRETAAFSPTAADLPSIELGEAFRLNSRGHLYPIEPRDCGVRRHPRRTESVS
jgi:hypothetical protein